MSAGPREYDCADMPRPESTQIDDLREGYDCFESNRDVNSVIYLNGGAITHGRLVDTINELIKENRELRRQRATLIDDLVDQRTDERAEVIARCHEGD